MSETEHIATNLGQTLVNILLWLGLIALLLACAGLIHWLHKPGNFDFEKIVLANKLENQQKEELLISVKNNLKGGFFSLKVNDFSMALLDQLPWVKSISVKKIWPNKLLLNAVEHKPVVRWQSVNGALAYKKGQENIETEYSLISQYGTIFEPELTSAQQQRFSRLLLLTGSDDSAKTVLLHCMDINKQLKQLALGIKRCGMNNRRTWSVTLILKNGQHIILKLGKRQILQKLKRFIRIFSGRLKTYLKYVENVDLRYSNGFTVLWNKRSKKLMQSGI